MPCEDVVIPLSAVAPTPAIVAVSPTGTVALLVDGDAHIPDSLAILEYCAELSLALWPAERTARAHARAMAAEMHSGFSSLRQAMPMVLGRHAPGIGHTQAALRCAARIDAIWSQALAASGGPFLFGTAFGAADAMYAPMVARFLSYEPPLNAVTQGYCAAVRAKPNVEQW